MPASAPSAANDTSNSALSSGNIDGSTSEKKGSGGEQTRIAQIPYAKGEGGPAGGPSRARPGLRKQNNPPLYLIGSHPRRSSTRGESSWSTRSRNPTPSGARSSRR